MRPERGLSPEPKVDEPKGVRRRDFGKLCASAFAAVAAGGCRGEAQQLAETGYLLPPPNAKLQTTACAYCIVACGYKAFTWPVGVPCGGPAAADNAFGLDFPVSAMAGCWVAPQMYNVVDIGGDPHHIVVVPDVEAEVVNVGGDYNLGGSLAQRFYSPHGSTADRLLRPQLRVGSQLRAVAWDEAISIAGELSRHVLDNHGPLAWGMKSYSYQFYENTYAITKFCFDAIETPCWAPHDQPGSGSSTPGLSDTGINAFSAAYSDWAESEVLFVSGVGLCEQRGVLFSGWVKDGPELIVVNPRRDETADYALESGGMFLQVRPGTDTLLHHAIARIILTSGWQDSEFIAAQTVSAGELAMETGYRRNRFGLTFSDYQAFILGDDLHRPENAAAITGVPTEHIYEAARRMAAPRPDGTRPKTSLMLEKGNYWSHNYANSASFASLGILVGAGNRPGRVIARGGGHQRGMIKGGSYPTELSPETLEGRTVPLNLDRWLLEGNLRLAWVVGCTWVSGGSAAAGALREQVLRQTHDSGQPQLSAELAFPAGDTGPCDVDYVVATLKARIDGGGMAFIQQDIYPQPMTQLADLVLPAASWGEAPFCRMQGERRLRHYAHLVDSPGEAKPDWQIIAAVARYMGYDGFDWEDANAVFEEAAEHSRNSVHDYAELVGLAKDKGMRAHDFLASLGTTGIQCPIRREGDTLVGTVRLHEGGFSTASNKAPFLRSDYRELVDSRDSIFKPRGDELQIINRRHGAAWSSLVEDQRNPFRVEQLPENFLELHPDDAEPRGIAHGDVVAIEPSDEVESNVGSIRAVATLTDAVRPGVACTYFNFRGDPRFAANTVVPNSPDPVSNMFSFKLGRGRVFKVTDPGWTE